MNTCERSLCFWTVNLHTMLQFFNYNIVRFLHVKIHTLYAFRVVLKMSSFLGLRWFLRIKKPLQEWRAVKNVFLPCSPQKTTDLCAELANLGTQPWSISAAAQIVVHTLLSPHPADHSRRNHLGKAALTAVLNSYYFVWFQLCFGPWFPKIQSRVRMDKNMASEVYASYRPGDLNICS